MANGYPWTAGVCHWPPNGRVLKKFRENPTMVMIIITRHPCHHGGPNFLHEL